MGRKQKIASDEAHLGFRFIFRQHPQVNITFMQGHPEEHVRFGAAEVRDDGVGGENPIACGRTIGFPSAVPSVSFAWP